MRGGFRIGRIFGVDIRIDWGLFVIFWLVAVSLGAGVLPARHPEWSAALTWFTALAAAVLFFASVLIHELSHALVARAYGIPVRAITLFIFGGVANIQREPPSPRAELLMAAVGPLTSIVLGVALTGAGMFLARDAVASVLGGGDAFVRVGPAATLLLWLGPINVVLGFFNLLPGFPLDGGRILRALLWAGTKDLNRATRWASRAGQLCAAALIITGLSMVFGIRVPFLGTGIVPGIWLAFIGWFLNSAAVASYQQVVVRDLLEDVPVSRLMQRGSPTVSPEATVEALVDHYIMGTDQRAFPVADGDRLIGIVCLEDVRKVKRSDWPRVLVQDIMTTGEHLEMVRPDVDAADALQTLSRRDVEQVPVVENGRLLGMLRRRDILRWLELQQAGAAPVRV